MGILKRSPMDDWADDLEAVVSNNRNHFIKAERNDRRRCTVTMSGGRQGVVGCNGDAVLFTMKLDNVRDISRRSGLPVPEAYGKLASMMTTSSLGLDAGHDLHISYIIPKERYDVIAMGDVLFRWVYAIIDYEMGLRKLYHACGGGE